MSIVRSAAVAVTVTAVLLALHPGIRREPGLYDEGNTVYAAWRVAEGQVLYRDLWTIHAPGMPHLLALVFAAFGTTIVVERALKLSLLGLLSALGYACFRRFLSPLAAATSVASAPVPAHVNLYVPGSRCPASSRCTLPSRRRTRWSRSLPRFSGPRLPSGWARRRSVSSSRVYFSG